MKIKKLAPPKKKLKRRPWLLNAALNHIPQTNSISGKYPVPWWNEECKAAHGARKIARRRYQRTKTLTDKIALNRASAVARRTKRTSRKQNWQDYVSSVNSETPIPKIWKKNPKNQTKIWCIWLSLYH